MCCSTGSTYCTKDVQVLSWSAFTTDSKSVRSIIMKCIFKHSIAWVRERVSVGESFNTISLFDSCKRYYKAHW